MSLNQGGEKIFGTKKHPNVGLPGNSLHLNSMLNIWNLMTNKVSEKHPSSLGALQTALKEV